MEGTDGILHLPPLIRLLDLNSQSHETWMELRRLPLSSPRIAELQENMDRCQRASLTTCWLAGGYELEEADDEEDLAM